MDTMRGSEQIADHLDISYIVPEYQRGAGLILFSIPNMPQKASVCGFVYQATIISQMMGKDAKTYRPIHQVHHEQAQ